MYIHVNQYVRVSGILRPSWDGRKLGYVHVATHTCPSNIWTVSDYQWNPGIPFPSQDGPEVGYVQCIYTYTSLHVDPYVRNSGIACPSQDGPEVYAHTCPSNIWTPVSEYPWSPDYPGMILRYIHTTSLHADPCVRVSTKSWYTMPILGWSRGRLCRYWYMW